MPNYREWTAVIVMLAVSTHTYAATIMDFPENAAVKGKAELSAYNFRSAPPVARQCAGQTNSGSITVTKPVDALSPQLADAAKAKSAVQMQIDDNKPDGSRVAYLLTGATVSAITPKPGGDKPMEQVAFNFSKVQWIVPGCKPAAPPPRRVAIPEGVGGGGGYRY